jgi:pimeloyl-ACP methyl ester carboxylesterase
MTDGLLLIHAFPLDSTMWKPQLDEFGSRMTVFAPNLPGFGNADPIGDVMGMDASADLIAASAREQGISHLVVCGLSMGGYVALELWSRHPDLVDGLVFANTKASPDDDAAKSRRKQLADRLLAEGNGFLAENPPPLLSENAPGELLPRVKNLIAAQPATSIAAASLGMAARRDFTAELRNIAVPTLVITSENDRLIPPDATKPMADGIPNARYEVIPRAGHLSNLEAPEHFNRLLREHLDRVAEFESERGHKPPKGMRTS